MKNTLKNIRIVHALLLVCLLPLIALIILSMINLDHLQQRLNQSKATIEIIELTKLLDNLIEQNSRERDLNYHFLSSEQKTPETKLLNQREKSDKASNQLINLNQASFKHIEFSTIENQIEKLKKALEKKAETRKSIDSKDPNNTAFENYSHINHETLNTINLLLLIITDASLNAELNLLLSSFWIKERATQSRNELQRLYSTRWIMPADFYAILDFIKDEKQHLKKYELYADKKSLTEINALKKSDHWKKIGEIQKQFMKRSPSGIISDPTRGSWNELSTKRIEDIKGISNYLISSLASRATEYKNSAQSKLYAQYSALLIIILFLAITNGSLITSLKNRISGVQKTLNNISHHSDLTLRMQNEYDHNELGKISRNINYLLDNINAVFKGFKSTSADAMSMAGKIMTSAEKSSKNASSQHIKTDELLISMNELSSSASDISTNMNNARDSMVNANNNAQKSRSESDIMRNIFGQLTTDFTENFKTIETLAAHSQEISTILDTISGIAEQTNLLALNAAIEAARAGDQGRGFSVVADEVRSLAQKTQESTTDIRDMIERLEQSTHKALTSMNSSQSLVNDTEKRVISSDNAVVSVSQEIQKSQETIDLVTNELMQQTSVIRTMEKNVEDMKQLSESTLKNTQQVDSIFQPLIEKFGQLDKKIQSFKV